MAEAAADEEEDPLLAELYAELPDLEPMRQAASSFVYCTTRTPNGPSLR
jgi:hypothetical protein